jgi:DNA-binding transcriptional MerR regulator
MKIAAVSEQYGMSSDTLRYYERIGLIPPVNRNGSGIRDYSELDIRRVEFIKCMRSAGLPIEVLIDYMELVQQGDRTVEARKEILKEQRDLLAERIHEMHQTLDLLNYKIEVYENALLAKEKAIVQIEE